MSPARKRIILTVICLLLGAHYVAIAGRLDHWPLSYYGMFARRKPPSVTSLVLVGVTSEGEELCLRDRQFWAPFNGPKLAQSLRIHQRADAKRADDARPHVPTLPAAVESLLSHYESRRAAGQHRGPPLAGLRLYDFTWRIDPALANLDSPDRQELVCEHFPES
jgi:hypothetical protein